MQDTASVSPAVLDALQCADLMSDMAPDALVVIGRFVTELQGSAGNRLYSEGDRNPALYVIVSGTCEVTVDLPDGTAPRVRSLGPGDCFGELSLLLRGERLVNVTALDDVRLLELDDAAFRRLKSAEPEVCLHLIMAIVRRLGRVLDGSREPIKRLLMRHAASAGRL